jgi:hypothetical protein
MSPHPPRQQDEQQRAFLRQAGILRKNLIAWDSTLHSVRGEDWPSMLGRLNAAFNQAGNLDRGIDDASEHFAYVPRRCLANAQDVAFFLSTRLVVAPSSSSSSSSSSGGGERDAAADGGIDGKRNDDDGGDGSGRGGEEPAAARLRRYERRAAELASEFEGGMIRF